MLKNILNRTVLAGLALLTSACTANYLDINSNPYEVSKDQMQADGYGLGAAINGMSGVIISSHVNTTQMTDNLLGCTQGGYFGDTGSWPYTISQFNATNDWTRVFLYSDQVIFDTNPATRSQTLMTISSFESTYSARRIPKDSSGYWPSIPSMISLVLDGLIPRERRCDVNHWNDFS